MPHDLARSFMRASLLSLPLADDNELRVPGECEKPALARLMHDAYAETVDYQGEDEEHCLREIERTFSGEYGDFNQHCSRVACVDGAIAAAALLTRWQERPFVVFCMTARPFIGRGLARACLIGAMHALHEHGEFELRLIVTLANARALSLYKSLGFQLEDDSHCA